MKLLNLIAAIAVATLLVIGMRSVAKPALPIGGWFYYSSHPDLYAAGIDRGADSKEPPAAYITTDQTEGFATIAKNIDATPYRGKRIRFTALIAVDAEGYWEEVKKLKDLEVLITDAKEITPEMKSRMEAFNRLNKSNVLWLAEMWPDRSTPLEKFVQYPIDLKDDKFTFGIPNRWEKGQDIELDIASDAVSIVYGIGLQGKGTVWIMQPKLEIIGDAQPAAKRHLIHQIPLNQVQPFDFPEN